MTIDERHRHALHEAARRTFGDEPAATLMEMLPPVGWADVATKRDLDLIRADVRADLATLDRDLTNAMMRLSNRLTMWFVGTGVAVIVATGIFQLA